MKIRSVMLCSAALALTFTACVESAGGDVSVSIESPQAGDVVPAGEPIVVGTDLSGADLGVATSEGVGHLHVRVDDGAMQMIDSESTEVTLSRGEHVITVEYTDSAHESFEPPVTDSVTVRAR